MAGIEFFPKVDRGAGLESAKANNASSKTAKKGASAPTGDSFADILSTPKKKDDQASGQLSSRSERPADRLSERPSNKSSIRKDEPAVVRQPVREAGSAEPVRSTAAREIRKLDNETQEAVTAQEKSTLKDKAVVEFMGEMEAKFGVSPDQIIEAFSQLDQETLAGRPEDAMNEFLAALQIPPAQLADAQKLYIKMVNETGAALVNEQVSGDKKADVDFAVLSPKEMRMQKLHASLDNMSNSFFPNKQLPNARLNMFADPMANNVAMMDPNASAQMQNAQSAMSIEGMQAVDQNAQATELSQSANGEQKSEKKSLFGLGAALGGAAAATAKMSAQSQEAGDASSSTSMMSSSVSQGLDTSSALGDSSANQSQDFSGNSGNANSQAEQLLKNLESATSNLGQLAPASFAAASAAAAKSAYGASESRGSETDVRLEGDMNSIAAAGLAPKAAGTTEAVLRPDAMILAQPQASSAEKQENINEIIRNAQVMLKKGGGEMNMQLRPEGLGSVNLKVLVQDGQVSVQMITENSEAKKLLEGGLSDLKHQLTANKLHVETMKVEAAADSAMQKFEQQMHDQQKDQQRQQASNFLNAFREDRQGFAQGFMDRPMMGGYNQKQQKRRTLAPQDTAEIAAASSAKNGRQTDGARRLNLVA